MRRINTTIMDNGILKSTLTNWKGVVYKIPLEKIDDALQMKQLNNAGIYLLCCLDGETRIGHDISVKSALQRVVRNNKGRLWWNRMDNIIVITSKDNSLNNSLITVENSLYSNLKVLCKLLCDNLKKKRAERTYIEQKFEGEYNEFCANTLEIFKVLNVSGHVDEHSTDVYYEHEQDEHDNLMEIAACFFLGSTRS